MFDDNFDDDYCGYDDLGDDDSNLTLKQTLGVIAVVILLFALLIGIPLVLTQ